MQSSSRWAAVLVTLSVSAGFLSAASPEGNPGSFKALGTFVALGQVLNELVAPGIGNEGERLYQTYIYDNIPGTFDLVSVDPYTGRSRTFTSPLASESGAWALALGPDHLLYLGTLPSAHIMRLEGSKIVDLGRASPTETHLWQLVVGSDQKLYGGTYPHAKLIRFDPKTNRMEDLGSMDATQQYAHYVAADNAGFVYAGVGPETAGVVAYEIGTKRSLQILPATERTHGVFATVFQSPTGDVYSLVNGHYYRLQGFTATRVMTSPGVKPTKTLSNGDTVNISEGMVVVKKSVGTLLAQNQLDYKGQPMRVYQLAMGPDDHLYASGVLPLYFMRFDGAAGFSNLGKLGDGEAYSMMTHRKKVLLASYAAEAPLIAYDPLLPYKPGTTPGSNPIKVHFPGENSSWRPLAMTVGPDQKVYVGARAGYGFLGGPLVQWDLDTNGVTSFQDVVKEQGIVSLTTVNGMLAGGTTVLGGLGVEPTQKEAKLFIWDVVSKQKIYETVPIPGKDNISVLVTAGDGWVYGLEAGSTIFVFDPIARKVVYTVAIPADIGVAYHLGIGPDHKVWIGGAKRLGSLDPATRRITVGDVSPAPISNGFVIQGQSLYFASGATLYEYRWFEASPDSQVLPSDVAPITDLHRARARPNPWRADKHGALPVTFDRLTNNSTIKIFTLSGKWVTTLEAPGGSAPWDLTNGEHAAVASGTYIYTIVDQEENHCRGQIVVIK